MLCRLKFIFCLPLEIQLNIMTKTCQNALVLIFVMLFHQVSSAQDSKRINFEAFISTNYSNIEPSLGHGLLGYGIGMHSCFFSSKKINLITGLEYNRNNFYVEKLLTGHYGSQTDITYHIDHLTLPLIGRINFGDRVRKFVNLGAYLDMVLKSIKEHPSWQFPPSTENDQDEMVKSDANLNGDYGISLGGGVSFPIDKYRLSFLLEYKHGLNIIYDDYEEFKMYQVKLNIGFVF